MEVEVEVEAGAMFGISMTGVSAAMGPYHLGSLAHGWRRRFDDWTVELSQVTQAALPLT